MNDYDDDIFVEALFPELEDDLETFGQNESFEDTRRERRDDDDDDYDSDDNDDALYDVYERYRNSFDDDSIYYRI